MDDAMTVGQLARRSGLTTKALRHYHRLGLLVPDVDGETGYRSYPKSAASDARLIAGLRQVDLPLSDVRRCLEAGDREAVLREVLTAHRTNLDARVTRLRGYLHRLDHLTAHDEKGNIQMSLTDTPQAQPAEAGDPRRLGIDLFNRTWTLLEQENRSTADDDRMVNMAHASAFHWEESGGRPENRARSHWQISRVYAVLGRAEPSLHHARRVIEICLAEGVGDWDLAFAYEALARAHAVAGDSDQAREVTEQALVAAEAIAEEGDRALVLADLETIPGQPRFW